MAHQLTYLLHVGIQFNITGQMCLTNIGLICYRFSFTRIFKEKDKIVFKIMFQNDHPQPLYTSRHTYWNLSQSPLPLWNPKFLSHPNEYVFPFPIERIILTVFQKISTFTSWMVENVQNFNDSCSQSVLIEIKYSSIKINLKKTQNF